MFVVLLTKFYLVVRCSLLPPIEGWLGSLHFLTRSPNLILETLIKVYFVIPIFELIQTSRANNQLLLIFNFQGNRIIIW